MKKKKGFTLIEILVVMAILALLMIIAVPGIMGISAKMKERGLTSKLDSIKEGARVYAQNNSNQIKSKILALHPGKTGCTEESSWCTCDADSKSGRDCKYIYIMTVDELISVGAFKSELSGNNTSSTTCDVADPTNGSRCLDCLKVKIHLDDDYKSADAYIDEKDIEKLDSASNCS